jgi:cytochrome d ubiquinol oxidase subunit II
MGLGVFLRTTVSRLSGGGDRRDDARHPVVNGHFAGHTFVGPSVPILTGVGLVLGYALLGAGWIVYKSEGVLRDWTYARIPWLVMAVFVVLGLAFTAAVTLDAGAIAQSNLQARGWGLAFPILGVAALIGVVLGARARLDAMPFFLTTLFFFASDLTLGVMFWPTWFLLGDGGQCRGA